jgi:hypothetical protein
LREMGQEEKSYRNHLFSQELWRIYFFRNLEKIILQELEKC